ncbi:MAG: CDGSH iron-sulfur domain-containing protein [Armatimonadetes bacterium]|nr:CDGSH iron-sulfur domain-containing protein [Armatimonadota bacterium]
MAELKVTVRPNGPYVIQGPVQVVDWHGHPYPVSGPVTALCRCGHSENKPFCDGSHKRVGFQHEEPAPAE